MSCLGGGGESRFIPAYTVSLDQVRVINAFNFKTLYESTKINMEDNVDSPFSQLVNNCDYYESQQFRNKCCEIHRDSFSSDFIDIGEVFNCYKDSLMVFSRYQNIITLCRDNNNGGGIGLFVKDFKIRNDLSVFVPHVFESLLIEIV